MLKKDNNSVKNTTNTDMIKLDLIKANLKLVKISSLFLKEKKKIKNINTKLEINKVIPILFIFFINYFL